MDTYGELSSYILSRKFVYIIIMLINQFPLSCHRRTINKRHRIICINMYVFFSDSSLSHRTIYDDKRNLMFKLYLLFRIMTIPLNATRKREREEKQRNKFNVRTRTAEL